MLGSPPPNVLTAQRPYILTLLRPRAHRGARSLHLVTLRRPLEDEDSLAEGAAVETARVEGVEGDGDVDGAVVRSGQPVPALARVAAGEDTLGGRGEEPQLVVSDDLVHADRRARRRRLRPLAAVAAPVEALLRAGDKLHLLVLGD